ncbi:hypothetical protein AX16_006437 [Volvariella volvacea WC 439]|nr:hypothetical protein AX16_006437 [Volvariella volvacea WC 439]
MARGSSPSFVSRRSTTRWLTGPSLLYAISVFASLGVFLFGYDQGVMSGIITGPHFREYFNYPGPIEVGTMVAVLEIGAFITSVAAGQIGDNMGRKGTITWGAVIFTVGGVVQTFTTGFWSMIVGRVISGFGVGLLSTIVPIYQSEISPPEHRGALACMEFTGNIIGYSSSVWTDYFCSFIDSDLSWRIPLFIQCVIGTILAAGSLLLPESPRWLIDTDQNQAGKQVIADLHGGNPNDPMALAEFEEIMEKVCEERESGEERTYAMMWRKYKRRVLLAMSSQAFAQLNGINVISYYAPRVFEEAGWIGREAILMTGINSIIYILSTLPPWYLVDKWGRRTILLSGAVIMGLALGATGWWMSVDLPQTPNAVVICVIIFNAAFGYSWGPVPWLYPPEIMPLSIRAKGVSLSTATNWAFNFLVGEVTPYLQDLIEWRLYPLHGFFCACSFVLGMSLYPETKGVPLEEMDAVFGEEERETELENEEDEEEMLSANGETPGFGSSRGGWLDIFSFGGLLGRSARYEPILPSNDDAHPNQIRYASNSAAVTHSDARPNTHLVHKPTTFEDLGLHPPIVAALRSAFPNVTGPTETQAQFIPAILSGRDVLLKDVTGSGKSFGLVLALLNKPRIQTNDHSHITSLVMVPHRELAHQFFHWIQQIHSAASGGSVPSIENVAQVLVREGQNHLGDGLAQLKKVSPHILIATPQAIMDIWKASPDALPFSRLSSVVVDEVDYLVETVPKKDPNRSFVGSYIKATKKLKAHPGITRELLDVIFAERKRENERRKDEPGAIQQSRRSGKLAGVRGPQLVMASATMRRHLTNYLFEESGWLNRDSLLKVRGSGSAAQKDSGTSRHAGVSGLGGKDVRHSVLIVSDEGIKNIEGAVNGPQQVVEGRGMITPEDIFGGGNSGIPTEEIDQGLVERYANTPSPFNPNALEAIATAFALDVPSVALLVLDGSAPVQRAVYELREMGVNAQSLDGKTVWHGSEKEPVLVVCTGATIRGMDLPWVGHVFIMGVLGGRGVNGRTVDSYVHVAGRVGRLGKEGGRVLIWMEEQ